MEEIEVKFLDVDPKEMGKRIEKLGGKQEFDRLYRVITFDYPDLRLNEQAAWVRLRDEGDKVTLAYKQRQGVGGKGQNDASMLEHEVVVSNFEATAQIFRSIGLIEKFNEEKRRIRYRLDGVELDIDEMPLIRPYLEIEGKSWAQVDEIIKKLGLNVDDKKIFSAFQIYELAGINMLDYQTLTFAKQTKRK